MIHHGSEGGHPAGEVLAAVIRQGIPRRVLESRETVGNIAAIHRNQFPGRECGVAGDEAELFHPRESFVTENIPSPAIKWHELFDAGSWGVDRKMWRGMGQVEEPRFGARSCFLLAGLFEELKGVVREDVCGIESPIRIGQLGSASRGQPLVFRGIPLGFRVGNEVAETVVVLETTRNGAGIAKVPLADHPCGIASPGKHLRDGAAIRKEVSGIGRAPAGVRLSCGHISDSCLVGVQPGHEGGTGRATPGRIVKVGEPDSTFSNTVDAGGRDFSAVTAQIRISKVVGKDQEDVRPGSGGLCCRCCGRAECLRANRQDATVSEDRHDAHGLQVDGARVLGSGHGTYPPVGGQAIRDTFHRAK